MGDRSLKLRCRECREILGSVLQTRPRLIEPAYGQGTIQGDPALLAGPDEVVAWFGFSYGVDGDPAVITCNCGAVNIFTEDAVSQGLARAWSNPAKIYGSAPQ